MRRLLLLASAMVFLDLTFFTAIAPLLPTYVHDLHLSTAQAGILSASYAAGTLLAALPAGYVASNFGPRRTVIIGLIALGQQISTAQWAGMLAVVAASAGATHTRARAEPVS